MTGSQTNGSTLYSSVVKSISGGKSASGVLNLMVTWPVYVNLSIYGFGNGNASWSSMTVSLISLAKSSFSVITYTGGTKIGATGTITGTGSSSTTGITSSFLGTKSSGRTGVIVARTGKISTVKSIYNLGLSG